MHFHSSTRRNSTTTRKILSVLLVIGGIFFGHVFAAGTTSTTLDGLQQILQQFISLMSRGWVVLAALAGKFMTNDWVFGSALHMDIYLWKIWNIMKNFANFTLLAILLGSIIKGVVGKEKLDVKGIITKSLIAGILIQASRFAVGALIDVSTVAVSAVGSFPSSFMGSNVEFSTKMNDYITKIKGVSYTVDLANTDTTKIVTQNPDNSNGNTIASNEDIMQSLLPNANSLGGPLIFLGMSTFRFYEYLTVSNPNTETLAIGFSMKTIVLIMFTVGLLLLLIANIVRVAYLRIFIIGSPFIVLFQVFKKKIGDGKGFTKYLNVTTLMDLIFKPVIFMAMMSLILILVVSIQNVMTSQSTIELNGVSMSVPVNSNSATIAIQDVSSLTINDNLFKDISGTSKSIFADLILFFLTIFLMRELIKRSLTSGEGPIATVIKPITAFAENFMKTAPILGGTSISAMQKTTKEVVGGYADKLGFDKNNRKSGKLAKGETEAKAKMRKLLGLGDTRTNEDYTSLDKTISNGPIDSFWTTSTSIASGQQDGEGLSIANNPNWKVRLEAWLEKYGSMSGSGFTGVYDKIKGLQDYFDGTDSAKVKNRRTLFEKMGGEKNSNLKGFTKEKPPTYEQLINTTFYAK